MRTNQIFRLSLDSAMLLLFLLLMAEGKERHDQYHRNCGERIKVNARLWKTLLKTAAFRQRGETTMNMAHVRRFFWMLLCIVTMLGCNSALAREDNEMAQGIPVKITVGNQVLRATFLDNATSRELVARFPLTVSMMDLYGREMCYRFPEALPADEARRSGYDVGDIAYWTPRHSFVIFYEQNGEIIGNLQKIGRIHSDVDLFARTGDTDVTFELPNE